MRSRAPLPRALRPLFMLTQALVPACALSVTPARFSGVSPAGRGLAGQCDNAAALFKHFAGDAEAGWKTMNLPADAWEGGSHWFLVHEPTGLLVDPTAAQFPVAWRIPYERARGRTSGGVRYARGATGERVRLPGRKAVRDLLERLASESPEILGRLRRAGEEARAWSLAPAVRASSRRA